MYMTIASIKLIGQKDQVMPIQLKVPHNLKVSRRNEDWKTLRTSSLPKLLAHLIRTIRIENK